MDKNDVATAKYYAKGSITPQKGDLIYYLWTGSSNSVVSHVGIVYDADSRNVYTIEGNTIEHNSRECGGVYRCTRSLTMEDIIGYCRITY
jgi:triacylglycerol esterase/lipase EstA (alpha/beta hydrolase family)